MFVKLYDMRGEECWHLAVYQFSPLLLETVSCKPFVSLRFLPQSYLLEYSLYKLFITGKSFLHWILI